MRYRKIADHTPKGYLIDLFDLGFPEGMQKGGGLWDNIWAKRRRLGKFDLGTKKDGTVTDEAIRKSQKQEGGDLQDGLADYISREVPFGREILRTFGQDPVYNEAVRFQSLPENVAKQQAEIDRFDPSDVEVTEGTREASLDTSQPLIKRMFGMLGETAMDYYDRFTTPGPRKVGLEMGGNLYNYYQDGGELPRRRELQPPQLPEIEPFSAPGIEEGTGQTPLSSYLADVATFAPDVANIAASRRLPSVPTPQQETPVTLERYSDDAIVADMARQFRGVTRGIGENVAQAGAATAATASTLASYLNERNKALDQNRRLNAQIGAQEAALNAQIGARNTQRINRYLEERQRRRLAGQQIRSGALASVSEKIQAREAERNQMELDRLRLNLLGRRFEESGVMDRNLSDLLDRYESIQ